MTAYAAMTLPTPALETFIDRVNANQLNRAIDDWKQLRREGWDVVALIAPDNKTIVALGCRGGV